VATILVGDREKAVRQALATDRPHLPLHPSVQLRAAKAESQLHGGQELRDVSCRFHGGDEPEPVVNVADSIAAQGDGLAACAPTGGAFRVAWTWSRNNTSLVQVLGASDRGGSPCIVASIEHMHPVHDRDGNCQATLLVGEKQSAAKAADVLAAKLDHSIYVEEIAFGPTPSTPNVLAGSDLECDLEAEDPKKAAPVALLARHQAALDACAPAGAAFNLQWKWAEGERHNRRPC